MGGSGQKRGASQQQRRESEGKNGGEMLERGKWLDVYLSTKIVGEGSGSRRSQNTISPHNFALPTRQNNASRAVQ